MDLDLYLILYRHIKLGRIINLNMKVLTRSCHSSFPFHSVQINVKGFFISTKFKLKF